MCKGRLFALVIVTLEPRRPSGHVIVYASLLFDVVITLGILPHKLSSILIVAPSILVASGINGWQVVIIT